MTAPSTGCFRLDAAVDWLLATPRDRRPSSVVPHLKRTFGITAAEACKAIRVAQEREAADRTVTGRLA